MKRLDPRMSRPPVHGRATELGGQTETQSRAVTEAQRVSSIDAHAGSPASQEPAAESLALIAYGEPTSAAHGMTGPSSWLASRLSPAHSPEDGKRRSLKALAKLLDTSPFDAGRFTDLALEAKKGGFGAAFAQALTPHAGEVLSATLAGATSLPDLIGALELLKETVPAEAFGALAAHAVPALKHEVAALSALSDAIMALPRGVDGRATQRAVDQVEGELVPRVRQLRTLAEVAGLDLHAQLAVGAPADVQRPSPVAMKALQQIAAQRKGDAREVSVHVHTRADAEAILGVWLAKDPLVDTSAMSPTLVKHLLGRARTFHWDDTFGKDGIITGHYPGSDHGLLPHLQIHTADGQEVRVFFPKQFARTEEGA